MARAHLGTRSCVNAQMRPIRTRAGRGPPVSNLS
jgi:hypothetical protein